MPRSAHELMQHREDEFRRALEAFEMAVETPFVPGELERWIASVDECLQRLTPLLEDRLNRIHQQEFAEISQEDPGLQSRVDALRQQDRENLEQAAHFEELIPRIKLAIDRVEPDEARVIAMLEDFVEDALHFVIEARRQEVAIRTWFVEAFERDRGTID